MSRLKLTIVPVAAVLAITALLIGANELHRRLEITALDRTSTTIGTGAARVGAPFTLADTAGRAVSDKDFRGRKMFLVFASPADADGTSAALRVASAALADLPGGTASIAAVFVSLDSSPGAREATRQMIASLAVPWTGLTGPADAVTSLAEAYYVPLPQPSPSSRDSRPPRGAPPSGSTSVYLVDEQGAFVAATPIPTDPARLRDWLQKKL